MPSTQLPPPKSPGPPAIKLPLCPTCGDEMRLTTLEPHVRFKNLDVGNFECGCGKTASDVIARP
jgi:hypothetical protein